MGMWLSINSVDFPLKWILPSAASSDTPYLLIQSHPRMTGSIKPLMTLQVIAIGTSLTVNLRRISPMDGTSDPLIAVPQDWRGVKKRLRYGLLTK